MHLKKIEMFGFKSFADKTELCFESGVTAIVGPNGVGKSNIAEAIKWVLGEQSARELRGTKMEDVIFNGSEVRSPLNFSEVSLTLYNKEKLLPIDYDEVVITRRVFRTGESQYLLNKTPVRLKDINDLLLGTGVGLDSYSIIGQGKIDLVLSSKPEERRYIFEEAAGITKFKSKKKEALRKLEHTENNLLRVNDVIKEVSRQISSIERQVRKATAYKQKFEQLKEKELKVASYSVRNLKGILNSKSDESESFQSKEQLLIEEIEKIKHLLCQGRQKLSEIDENLNKFYSRKANIDAQIESAKGQNSLNTERITELTERKENLERQVQSTQIKLQELEGQISKSREELSSLINDKTSKNQDIGQKERYFKEVDQKINEIDKDIKESKEKIFEVTTSESKNKNELVKVFADITNIRGRLRRLKVEKEEVEQDLEKTEGKISHLNTEKDNKSNKVDSLRKQKEQAVHSANSRRKILEEIKGQLNQLNQKAIRSQSKLEYLKALKRNFEGYQDGVKSILMAKEQNRLSQDDIIDSVANIIEVENGYEKAVEVALDKKVQMVIVEDGAALKRCIAYLKSNNLGDATFVCLDAVLETDSYAHNENFQFKPLLDAVKCSPQYKKVVNFLLADTYLVKDLEVALNTRERLNNPSFKLVTPDGDVVEKNVVTCGIRYMQESSLIGREAKIKSLEEDVKGFNEQIEKMKAGEEKEKEELENLHLTLQELEVVLQEEEINLANTSSTLKSIGEEKKRIVDEISLLGLELSETEEEESNLVQIRQRLEKQVEEINKASFELNSFMMSSEDLLKVKKEEREQLLLNITQLKTELFSLTDLEINQNQTIKMLEDSNSEQLALSNTQKQEIEDSKIRLESLQSDIKNTKQTIETLETERNTALAELEEALKLKEIRFKEIQEIEALISAKQKELEETKNVLHDFQVKATELTYQMQNLKERAFESYKLDIEQSHIEIEEDFNCEQAKEEVSALKQKLESMGTVNLVAIEEHKELQERFDFLSRQRQDLEEAKQSLTKAISKINITTRELFVKTFAKIQESFKDFFRLLFGGGKAELVLLDEKDVLESGIEIVVRPPGKKLQNISLLSGGEKALTAIALLFAVFKVKPSPFCILDEMDAPLDEANIDRFIKVLQDFLKTSQFIVVTHNKKTIGMADVMYGVTMEEAGVSKIVSVKFRDSNEVEETAAVNS